MMRNAPTEGLCRHGYRHRQMVQRSRRVWIHSTGIRGSDVFVHISAVQQAGLTGLQENQRVSFELEKDKWSGKMSATQIKAI
jgi:cold shock CspA family protein